MRQFLAVVKRAGASALALVVCLSAAGAAAAQPAFPRVPVDDPIRPLALAPRNYPFPAVGGTWKSDCGFEDGSRGTLVLTIRLNRDDLAQIKDRGWYIVGGNFTLKVIRQGETAAEFSGFFSIQPTADFVPGQPGEFRQTDASWVVGMFTPDKTEVLGGTVRFEGGRMLFSYGANSKVKSDNGKPVAWTAVP